MEHEIILTGEPPLNRIQYPIPISIKNKAEEFLKDLENDKIISKTISRYTSPAFFIKKKNNDLRPVVDYRNINKYTTRQHFPIPKIQEQLSELGGSKIFSQIDLRSGYYQITIKKEDREKTGFSIGTKTYVFNRMLFGLVNASFTFQACMISLFSDLNFVKIYLDDILVHSTSLSDHVIHLKQVFKILIENKASINFEKSTFYTEKVYYLGHIISSQGVSLDTTRISKFNIPEIKTKKEYPENHGPT